MQEVEADLISTVVFGIFVIAFFISIILMVGVLFL